MKPLAVITGVGPGTGSALAISPHCAGEQAAVACIPQIREQVFATEDFKEGIRSFVERRQAKFVGR